MKTINLVTTPLLFALLTMMTVIETQAQIQPSDEYFIGEWNALLSGLPDGDLPFIINITVKGDSLQARVYDEGQTYVVPIENITRKGETALTLSYYDYNNSTNVIINLTKKDENNITGNVLNMYTITATRRKQ